MKPLTLEAPAKINLTLDILGRRADGYHDMRMVMQSVSLGDTVTVAGSLLEISRRCRAPFAAAVTAYIGGET